MGLDRAIPCHSYSRLTPNAVAEILVHDDISAINVVTIAKGMGDQILNPLQRESKNYFLLNRVNSFCIADVLASNPSGRAESVSRDLYESEDILQRLVGAISLAARGGLPEKITADCFLVSVVHRDIPEVLSEHVELATIALGMTRSTNAVPFLIELLDSRSAPYWTHAYACQALAVIRDTNTNTISMLRQCLKDPDFYALPDAFRALIALGDKHAVPLAIDRISSELKETNSGFLVLELEKVTGQNYGYDRHRWNRWWLDAEESWSVPSRFVDIPFKMQTPVYTSRSGIMLQGDSAGGKTNENTVESRPKTGNDEGKMK